jgi:hypothetical protein
MPWGPSARGDFATSASTHLTEQRRTCGQGSERVIALVTARRLSKQLVKTKGARGDVRNNKQVTGSAIRR